MQRARLIDQQFGQLLVIADAGNDKGQKSIWLCQCTCGEQIIVANSSLKSGRTRSCGCFRRKSTSERFKESRQKSPSMETRLRMSEVRKGERHWNWKGGITSSAERERHVIEYKEWRAQVFARDEYTCQKCFLIGGNLVAHHIYAFNTYPELRTSVSNGITLCADCHDDFHHQYGRGDNTEEQLGIFLGD